MIHSGGASSFIFGGHCGHQYQWANLNDIQIIKHAANANNLI